MNRLSSLERINGFDIVLASASPRRHDLLSELGVKFRTTEIQNIDESYPENLGGREIALFLARKKSLAYNQVIKPATILITADTIVWHKGKVLSKPADRDEAVSMLRELSGQSHEVYTGVSLKSANKERSFCACTEVSFDKLSGEEIAYYVDTCNPEDKAGAYGIQEWIGLAGVTKIEGSYFNVMGLPVRELYRELEAFTRKKYTG
jgi:septum formation protein